MKTNVNSRKCPSRFKLYFYRPHVCIEFCQADPLQAKSFSQSLSSEKPRHPYLKILWNQVVISHLEKQVYAWKCIGIDLVVDQPQVFWSVGRHLQSKGIKLFRNLPGFRMNKFCFVWWDVNLNAKTASSQWVVAIPNCLTWFKTPELSKNATPSSIT